MDKELKAYGFATIAALNYALMGSCVKLAHDFPVEIIVFFRNVFCLFFLLPLIKAKAVSLATKKPLLHLIRAIAGLVAIYFFFFTAKKIFLVEAIVLINTNPLFIPIWMFLLFQEKLSMKRIALLIMGFVGVVFIVKPGLDLFQSIAFLGLASGIFAGLAMVMVRKMSSTEPVERIMFYFFTSSVILSAFPMIHSWILVKDPYQWLFLFLVGVFSFGFQYFITRAYFLGHPSHVSSMIYLGVVFSGIIGWTLWRQIPDIFSFIGITIIIICGILTINKTKRRIQRT